MATYTPRIHPCSLKLANSQEENISLLHYQNILLSHAAVAFIKIMLELIKIDSYYKSCNID